MVASFVVYIDESGDEGFHFEKGSSKWFVLSAIVTEKASDLETVKLVDKVRLIFNREPADKDPLHFRKLKHEQRLPFLSEIAKANLRAMTILVHKPSIINVERYQERNRLYFYSSRLLLEAVSRYCQHHKTIHTSGDGSAEICFSKRSDTKYDEFRTYMEKLKLKSQINDVQINWGVIKSEQISALSSKLMGMQIADAVASSFFFGSQLNQYGFAEEKYTKMLKPVVYHHEGRYSGYGVKIWPREAYGLIKTESHLAWLPETYNFEV
jgi:hypothetical protein